MAAYPRIACIVTLLCAAATGCGPGEAASLERERTIDNRDHLATVAVMRAMGGAPMALHVRTTAKRVASPADSLRADVLVVGMRDALGKYADTRVAERDGFRAVGDSGAVVHYVNWMYALEEALRFNPAKPAALVYRRSAEGAMTLLGAMYTAPAGASEAALDGRVPLGVARWHRHVDWCTPKRGDEARWTETGGDGSLDGLPVFGPASPIATRAACDSVAGVFRARVTGWMVHANVFGSDNPDSIWAETTVPAAAPAPIPPAPSPPPSPVPTPTPPPAATPPPVREAPAAPRREATDRGSVVSDGVSVGWERTTPGGKPGARHAAVILLHGAGDPAVEEPILRDVSARLVKRGYVVEVLQYFDRTHTTVAPAPRDQWTNGGVWLRTIGDAVTQLYQAPGVDSARLGLIGINLGGGLAMHSAQTTHHVKAVVNYFGVYRVKDPANVAKLPPVLLIQGDAEAAQVDALLTKYNVPHETDIYSVQPDSRQTADHVADFLAKYLPAN